MEGIEKKYLLFLQHFAGRIAQTEVQAKGRLLTEDARQREKIAVIHEESAAHVHELEPHVASRRRLAVRQELAIVRDFLNSSSAEGLLRTVQPQAVLSQTNKVQVVRRSVFDFGPENLGVATEKKNST